MAATPERGQNKPTVLVVDDAFLMRAVVVEILQDSGLNTVAAASGEEAIAYLRGPGHTDLVFSDIKMPGVDGFALARWVDENRPGIPVLLASGYTGKTKAAAKLCGVQFLHKPCDFDMIVTTVHEAIARKRACRG